MRLSYDWLKQYLDINVPVKQLAEKIERTVVEYDDIIEPSKGMKKLVVGKILSCKKHPNADRLKICQVDVGADKPLQIICGAPNCRAGKKAITAIHGARVGVNGNVKIKRAKMRGVRSNGMLCALDEIGFDKDVVPKKWQDGIYYLPDDAKIGAPVYDYLGMNDQIIDLSVTPNRGDMLSMTGIVHELAAIYNKKPHFTKPSVNEDPTHQAKFEVKSKADPKVAPIYKLRVLNNVDVHDSPLWLQIRLWNCGIQPKNNVIDVTNYIMLKYGQPIHAFDLDKLEGHELVARHAKQGETVVNNDKKSIKLDPKDVVVADAKQPVALAGVSGGLKANVDSKTKNIVLEAAAFDPIMVRMTSRRHSIHTESSKRFERGINHAGVGEALDDAAQLVNQTSKGQVASGIITVNDQKVEPKVITVYLDSINNVLGTHLSKDTVVDIFRRLGFKDQITGNQFRVTVPARRWDITIAPDLYEEVAKLYGYNNIPSTLPGGPLTSGELSPKQKTYRKSRRVLEGAGLSHAISYSLTTVKKAHMFMSDDHFYETKLLYPMSVDHAALRMNLISGLLDDVAYNQAHKVTNTTLFEQGRVFLRSSKDQQKPTELMHVAAIVSGSLDADSWYQKAKPVDFYQLKGILDMYLREMDVAGTVEYKATDKHPEMHPGRTADVYVGGQHVGMIGEVHPKVAHEFNVSKPAYVFELSLHKLMAMPKRSQQYQAVPKYPVISRDIALLLDKDISNQSVIDLIKQRGGKDLTQVKLFDVYTGKHVPAGKKSLAYNLVFQNPTHTLVESTVNKAFDKIQKDLKSKFNAQIR